MEPLRTRYEYMTSLILSRCGNRSTSTFGIKFYEMIIAPGVIEITCKDAVAAYFKIIQACSVQVEIRGWYTPRTA
jgi:hypothetical protein